MTKRGSAQWLAVTAVVAAVIALLAVVANAALWLDRQIVDGDAFTGTMTAVLVTEEARQVMAERIVEELVEDVPALILIRNPLVDVVASILASPIMEPAHAALASELHHRVTTGDPSAVVVTLVEVEEAVIGLLAEFVPGVAELIPDGFFTAIEVVEAGVAPSYAAAVGAAPWLWPLAATLAIILSVVLIALVPVRAAGLLAVGLALAAAGVIGLATAAGARAPLLDDVSDPALRALADLAYESLSQSFIAQTLWLVVCGVFLAGAGAVWLAFVRSAPSPASA